MKYLLITISLIVTGVIGYSLPHPPVLSAVRTITADDVSLPKGTTYGVDYIDVRCYKSDKIVCNDLYNGKEVISADNNN